VTAFFFGPDHARLYGYHPPATGFSTRGVVVCAPWGSEYQFAHRSLLTLARHLAGSGLHVLRFDYAGTGDSLGASTDADLDAWVEDVLAATEELRAVAGVERFDLVGLRLGAAVAARAMPRTVDADRVVLWDPIIDGGRFIREVGGVRPLRDGAVELDRTTVSAGFVDQLTTLDDSWFVELPADRTLVLTTSPAVDAVDGWAGRGIEHLTLDQPSPWVEDHSIWSGMVPAESIRAIVEWLG
jgi:alpha-beta hydrolase superfamily lysophospholipase